MTKILLFLISLIYLIQQIISGNLDLSPQIQADLFERLSDIFRWIRQLDPQEVLNLGPFTVNCLVAVLQLLLDILRSFSEWCLNLPAEHYGRTLNHMISGVIRVLIEFLRSIGR